MKVVFFHRKRFDGTYSLEGYFNTIRNVISPDIECVVAESKFQNRGLFKRILNIIEAAFRQGDINHITGDVHILCYLLRKNHTLLTILDCVFAQSTKGFKYKVLRFFWYVLPENRVCCISVISQSTKNELLKIISCNPDKIKVIPVCVSPHFIYNQKSFNSTNPVILQVGTGKTKNLFRLFEALEGMPCRLDIIGKLSAEQNKALYQYGINYRNSWNLSDPEIVSRYNECDIVTLISTYEGFGMPILEGNAVGRVVVTSNIFSMPEVAGDAACMVNPYDINEIRTGIRRVIEDNNYRTELIQNGVRNVRRFNLEIIARQYINIYNDLYHGRKCW